MARTMSRPMAAGESAKKLQKPEAKEKAKAEAKAKAKANAEVSPGTGAPKGPGAAQTAPSSSPDPKYEELRTRKDPLGKPICLYHAIYSKCNKGSECDFSHAPGLKLSDSEAAIVEAEWKRRAENRNRCQSPGKKEGFGVCRYYNSPGGCNRENCSFKHEKGVDQ